MLRFISIFTGTAAALGTLAVIFRMLLIIKQNTMKCLFIFFLACVSITAASQKNESSSFFLKITENYSDFSTNTIKIEDSTLYFAHETSGLRGDTNDYKKVVKLSKLVYLKNTLTQLLASKMDEIDFSRQIGDHYAPEYEIKFRYQNVTFERSFWGGGKIILQLYFVMKIINEYLPKQYQLKYVNIIDE